MPLHFDSNHLLASFLALAREVALLIAIVARRSVFLVGAVACQMARLVAVVACLWRFLFATVTGQVTDFVAVVASLV